MLPPVARLNPRVAILLATLVAPLIPIANLPLAPVAQAQLEEVIVTARRRAENLQETPISVSSVSGQQLENAGITSIFNLKAIVPNVQLASTTTKAPGVYVRGIGQRQINPETDPGVGQYLNGIYIPRQDALVIDAVDVSGIQILRGPQGTLFGKNNTGGAMLISTKEPHPDAFEGVVGVTVGNYDRQNFKLGLNLPLIEDAMGLRLNFSSKRLRGYEQNIADGVWFGDEDRLAGSARLRWEVNENFSADLFAFYSQQDERGLGSSCGVLNAEAAIASFAIHRQERTVAEQCAAQAGLVKDQKVGLTSDDSKYRLRSQMMAATLVWESDDWNIESTTAHTRQDDFDQIDEVDYITFSVIRNGPSHATRMLDAAGIEYEKQLRKQFTQELKFNGKFFNERVDYTTGVFYAVEKISDFPNGQVVGNNGLIGIPQSFLTGIGGSDLVIPLLAAPVNMTNFENTTRAVFAQASWDITEATQLTLGLRYTTDDKVRDIVNYAPDFIQYGADRGLIHLQGGLYNPISRPQFDAIDAFNPAVPYLAPTTTGESEDYTQLTPLFTLTRFAQGEWLDTLNFNSLMTYLTISQGYKSGGIALRGQRLSLFEPEVLDNTEIGFKLDAFDSKFRLNGAIFRMEYTEIQITQAEQGPGGQTDVIVFVSNAGEAVVQGIEMEATIALGNFTLNANAGYTDADYIEYRVTEADGSISDRADEPFAQVPKHNRSILAQYRWMTPVGLFIPSLHYFYQSEIFIGFDAAAIQYDDSFIGQSEVFNARLTWVPSEQLRVTLFANNAKDTLDYGGGVALGDNLGVVGKARTPPRSYGLEFNWTFDDS